MKKSLSLAAVLLASSTLGALAADMPARVTKAPEAVVAAYNWSGFYVGVNGGYGWAKYTGTVVGFTGTDDLKGPLAGGQVGINWQTGNFVFGVEADAQWANVELDIAGLSERVHWFGTVRGRFGIASNNWLFYATAGGAVVGFEFDLLGLNAHDSRFGWTAGGGIEVGFAPNWSVKAEYLYVRTANDTWTPFGVPLEDHVGMHVARAGINYRF
jgi:outer membrane immunogenic protein